MQRTASAGGVNRRHERVPQGRNSPHQSRGLPIRPWVTGSSQTSWNQAAHKFHYYNGFPSFLGAESSDPRQIRGQKLFARSAKPFLGELDFRSDRFGDPWDDDLANSDSTLERLQLLKQEGCELAMIWPELGARSLGG